MRIGTLFSGIGSPEQGAKRVYRDYLELVFACEWDKFARESFNANYEIEDKHFHSDIADMDGTQYKNKVDILIGGSPCQDFSLAGLRAGVDGNKGVLIYEYIRIIEEVQPPIFIYENVKGMLSDKGGRTIKDFVQAFRDMGYYCHYSVLNTKDYGVPQNRERIFLVGFKDSEHYHNFSFAPKIKSVISYNELLELDVEQKYYLTEKNLKHIQRDFGSAAKDITDFTIVPTLVASMGTGGGNVPYFNTKRLKDILEDSVDDKYYLSQKLLDGFNNHKERHTEKGTGFIFKPKDGDDIANCLRANAALCPTDNTIKEPILKQIGTLDIKGNDSIKRVYDADGLSPTLTTMGGGNRQPKIQIVQEDYRIRKLTPRECFRLQDFPDTFKQVVSNSQAYKQAGNSISVNVMEMIFNQIEASRIGNTDKGSLF